MPSVIDLDTLREMQSDLEGLVAMADRLGIAKMADEDRKRITVLKHVIAYHSGEIFPGEVAA